MTLKRIAFRSTILVACLAFAACRAKPAAEGESPNRSAFRARESDRRVLVVLGPGYAGKGEILAGASATLGLADAGGELRVLSYPADFTVEGRVNPKVLSEAAAEPRVDAVVALGAPAGFSREFAKIREARPAMPVVALICDDETLPLEASCGIVVDYATTDAAGVSVRDDDAAAGAALADEASSAIPDADLSLLLLAAVHYARGTEAAPVDRMTAAMTRAARETRQRGAQDGWSFEHFADPDTGLRSSNHLVASRRRAAQ